MVVVWHLPSPAYPFAWKPATWAGVDLFFVLSGFLIGSQLLRPYLRGDKPSFVQFYVRRAMRVLPAYLVVVALYFLVPQFRERPMLPPLWRFLTFTQNFGLDFRSAFSHAWSLCVEEHFYLALPFIVFWLMVRPSARKVWMFAGFIMLFGLVTRALLWVHYIKPVSYVDDVRLPLAYLKTVYYPTYARLDGLLVGVLLASAKLFRPKLWERITSYGNIVLCSGLLTLGLSFWICQDMYSFAAAVVGFPLLAIGFGMLVVSSLSRTSILSKYRLWGASIGANLAYCTYLTHKEVMQFDRRYLSGPVHSSGIAGLGVYFASIALTASALHICVERPFLKARDRVTGWIYRTKGSGALEPISRTRNDLPL